MEALVELLHIEIELEAWTRANALFRRLEALGGPGWAGARFELQGAEIAARAGQPEVSLARLLSAARRDPHSPQVLRALFEHGAPGGLGRYQAILDPRIHRQELARVHETHAQIVYAQGAHNQALRLLLPVFDLDPRRSSAQALQRAWFRDWGGRYALDALLETAKECPPEQAVPVLESAWKSAIALRDEHRQQTVARALLSIAKDEANPRRAMEIVRIVLAHDPFAIDHLEALKNLALKVSTEALEGPEAVLRLLGISATCPTPMRRIVRRPSALGTPGTAAPCAFPQDARIDDILEQVRGATDLSYKVSIDPWGGDRVLLTRENGVILGETLVDDATPAELRFHLARAFVLLDLDQASPMSPMSAKAERAANTLALLVAGDLEASVTALRRSDPIALVERFDSPHTRAAALRRSDVGSDLVAFVLSDAYIKLAAEGRQGGEFGSRF